MLICDDVIDISSASQRTHAPQNTSNNSGMHDGNSKKVSIILNRKHTQEINVVEVSNWKCMYKTCVRV